MSTFLLLSQWKLITLFKMILLLLHLPHSLPLPTLTLLFKEVQRKQMVFCKQAICLPPWHPLSYGITLWGPKVIRAPRKFAYLSKCFLFFPNELITSRAQTLPVRHSPHNSLISSTTALSVHPSKALNSWPREQDLQPCLSLSITLASYKVSLKVISIHCVCLNISTTGHWGYKKPEDGLAFFFSASLNIYILMQGTGQQQWICQRQFSKRLTDNQR